MSDFLAAAPLTALSPEEIRIGFFGESFVNGTGDPSCLGWTGRVCAQLKQQGVNLTYYNLGIRGETSPELEARFQQEAARRLPLGCDRRIVVSFGVNDTSIEAGRLRVELMDSMRNARRVVSTAQRAYKILMVGPPPMLDEAHNQRIQALSQHFSQMCDELHVPYLDVFEALNQSEVWKAEAAAGDGAHPSSQGYEELAGLVSSWQPWKTWFS
jgi:lysophospholipase L1-like esterase